MINRDKLDDLKTLLYLRVRGAKMATSSSGGGWRRSNPGWLWPDLSFPSRICGCWLVRHPSWLPRPPPESGDESGTGRSPPSLTVLPKFPRASAFSAWDSTVVASWVDETYIASDRGLFGLGERGLPDT
jgi:hypothetical protein